MTDFPIPTSWDRAGLESAGFVGFVPLIGLDPSRLPQRRGVYAVIRVSGTTPVFLDLNPVVKRKLYSAADLALKWIPDAAVVYIGKAESRKGIAERLGAFARQAANHSGGRALWQLPDADGLLVAWVETPDHVAESVEKSYLLDFVRVYGRLPFANWRY